jgi:ABC-type dipeptide/oligopeptide/nickel transport system ATPase component
LKKEVENITDPDTAALRETIKNAESTNQQIREARIYREKVNTLKAEEAASEDLSDQLQSNARRKREAIQKAQYPIEGLSLSDEYVTYRGIPFEQLSGAETLKVSMAVAMAVNPKLRVIRIKDGSLLDSKNLAIIDQMAGENNFQIWMESVDESGEIGIVIEAGEVKTNNYDKAMGKSESGSVLE